MNPHTSEGEGDSVCVVCVCACVRVCVRACMRVCVRASISIINIINTLNSVGVDKRECVSCGNTVGCSVHVF